ncbi:glycosyltransferase family 2 protein [Pectobacterium wasabiae]|uniref:Glycosyltransferase 2-like domain-containing protein n=1 Tax=Pectobacterium wasabiae TaxID=55208 RepID=A0AAW3EDL9_9GAMM|nr:hypothetical protein [Pectobacterium wasabiae]AOR63327.1 hypothetical protein A7983_08660 [Pectobacterium wasabiae CFBP 3304]EJS96005.1 WbdE [Pectobacterium wasabiae CFBP 3304]KFX04174.1 hypothetical protein JV38_16785 [Pectobacterium wasabiae]KGA27308.1 hypothetical protein KU73_16775 [Pectobacterium wasabiae]
MKIAAVVVLYNSKILNSETITNLFKSLKNDIELTIVIWNNGPSTLEKEDIQQYLERCKEQNIKSEIYQDCRNISLSMIYNFFIENNPDNDYYTIFDQDTLISKDFFKNIYDNKNYHVILPLIYSPNDETKIKSPSYPDHKPFHYGEFNLGDCYAIGSCISFSSHLVSLIKSTGTKCFDERYAFYRVDTEFFNNIKKFNSLKGICVGKTLHHLSEKDDPQKMHESKKLEVGYDKLLSRIYNRKKILLKNIIYCINLKIKYKISLLGFIKLIQCAITKKHPRTRFHIANEKSISSNFKD